jgi:hypothetical protein
MPDEFQVPLKEPFDPVYMKALFDVGYRQGKNDIPWLQAPVGLEDVEISRLSQGH